MTNISALHIYWAIATPTTGKTTKADLKKAAKCGFSNFTSGGKDYMIRHSSSIEKLKEMAGWIKGLSKKYSVVIITDKQFGKMDVKNNPLSVATKMQIDAAFII